MILTRILEKKQVSHLTYFNYVTGITVGSIAANMISESNESFMDDLLIAITVQSVFSIAEVEYAILEPNGQVSVMKKPKEQQITKSDMKISAPGLKYIPSEIIVDGKIIYDNLKELNLSENWLNTQLKLQNISSIEDIFYAEIQSDGTLFIQEL